MIKRYQNGSRTKSTMEAVTGENRVVFKLNNKARDLLLSDKLHKVSCYCCKYIKKIPLQKYEKETHKKAIMAVRGDESKTRKAKYNSCFTKDGKFTPMFDLTDRLEELIYQKYNIEIPNVYKYLKRTGCMGCPYGSRGGKTELELSLISEKQRKFVVEYFKESYEVLGIDVNKYLGSGQHANY